jgi:hypothetical protein
LAKSTYSVGVLVLGLNKKIFSVYQVSSGAGGAYFTVFIISDLEGKA